MVDRHLKARGNSGWSIVIIPSKRSINRYSYSGSQSWHHCTVYEWLWDDFWYWCRSYFFYVPLTFSVSLSLLHPFKIVASSGFVMIPNKTQRISFSHGSLFAAWLENSANSLVKNNDQHQNMIKGILLLGKQKS